MTHLQIKALLMIFLVVSLVLPQQAYAAPDPGEECSDKVEAGKTFIDVMDNGIIRTLTGVAALTFAISSILELIDSVINVLSAVIGHIGPTPATYCCALGWLTFGTACIGMYVVWAKWQVVKAGTMVRVIEALATCECCRSGGSEFPEEDTGICSSLIPNPLAGSDLTGLGAHMDPYDNIYMATACLCPTAILHNLQKLKAIYQVHNCCVEESCRTGKNVETCEKQMDQAICMYFEGSILRAVVGIIANIAIKALSNIIVAYIEDTIIGTLTSCFKVPIELLSLPSRIKAVQQAQDAVMGAFGDPTCEDLGFEDIEDRLESGSDTVTSDINQEANRISTLLHSPARNPCVSCGESSGMFLTQEQIKHLPMEDQQKIFDALPRGVTADEIDLYAFSDPAGRKVYVTPDLSILDTQSRDLNAYESLLVESANSDAAQRHLESFERIPLVSVDTDIAVGTVQWSTISPSGGGNAREVSIGEVDLVDRTFYVGYDGSKLFQADSSGNKIQNDLLPALSNVESNGQSGSVLFEQDAKEYESAKKESETALAKKETAKVLADEFKEENRETLRSLDSEITEQTERLQTEFASRDIELENSNTVNLGGEKYSIDYDDKGDIKGVHRGTSSYILMPGEETFDGEPMLVNAYGSPEELFAPNARELASLLETNKEELKELKQAEAQRAALPSEPEKTQFQSDVRAVTEYAVSALLNSVLDEYAYSAIDEVCAENWEASEPPSKKPDTTNNAAPDPDVPDKEDGPVLAEICTDRNPPYIVEPILEYNQQSSEYHASYTIYNCEASDRLLSYKVVLRKVQAPDIEIDDGYAAPWGKEPQQELGVIKPGPPGYLLCVDLYTESFCVTA